MNHVKKPDRRIRRTQKQLRGALLKLIKQTPYHQITVSQIVEHADISRATFYLHYNDKDELLRDSLDSHLSDMQTNLRALSTSDDPLLSLMQMSQHIFEHIDKNFGLYRALQTNSALTFVIQHQMDTVIKLLKPPIEQVLSDHDPLIGDRIAHQLTGALYGLVIWWLRQDTQQAHEVLARLFYDQCVSSLQILTEKSSNPP